MWRSPDRERIKATGESGISKFVGELRLIDAKRKSLEENS